MEQIEIWKDILTKEGRYQISTIGNVRSVGRIIKYYLPKLKKHVYKEIKCTLLKQFVCNKYKKVSIDQKLISVHRLVAEAFIENTENKPQVNHINGIKDDNRVENLEWVTRSENMIHSYSVLKNVTSNRKLTNMQVNEIRLYFESKKHKQVELSLMYNVSISTISKIINLYHYI